MRADIIFCSYESTVREVLSATYVEMPLYGHDFMCKCPYMDMILMIVCETVQITAVISFKDRLLLI